MKIKRHLAPAAGALLLVTGAASVALIGGGGTAATAAGQPSSAFGIELTIAGNEAIPPTPFVESTDGSLVEESAVPFPDNPVLSGGVLNASAQNGAAKASATDLAVGGGLLSELPPEVLTPLGEACTQLTTALEEATGPINEQVLGPLLTQIGGALDQISDGTDGSPIDLSLLGALDLEELDPLQIAGLCDVLAGRDALINADTIIAECTGDTGKTTITDLSALGLPVDIDVDEPGAAVSIPGLLTLTVNRQTSNADGTFTVDALHLSLLDQIELTVASATCGEVTRDQVDPGPSDAPAPDPVETHVPVTG